MLPRYSSCCTCLSSSSRGCLQHMLNQQGPASELRLHETDWECNARMLR